MSPIRLLLLVGLVLLAVFVYVGFLDELLTLENFKSQQANIDSWVQSNPLQAAGAFFGLYIAITAINIPGAAELFGHAAVKFTSLIEFARSSELEQLAVDACHPMFMPSELDRQFIIGDRPFRVRAVAFDLPKRTKGCDFLHHE